jgi:hypothetical protein
MSSNALTTCSGNFPALTYLYVLFDVLEERTILTVVYACGRDASANNLTDFSGDFPVLDTLYVAFATWALGCVQEEAHLAVVVMRVY